MSAERRQPRRPSEAAAARPAKGGAKRPAKPAAARPAIPPAKARAKRPAEPAAERLVSPEAEAAPAAMDVRERLREQQRATYREAILAAAERIFATRGFNGVRMSDVAAEAGMATGTLYNYFENKSEVLRSLIVARGNDLLRELEVILESERDPVARVERIVQATFLYVERHCAGYKMLSELAPSELALHQLGGPEVMAIQTRYLALLEAAMAGALRARRLRSKFSSRDLALYLAGAADGLARASVAMGAGARLADKIGLVMELFLSGASTKP